MVWAVLLFAFGIATNLLLSDPLRFRWWVAGLVVAAAACSAYFLWQARCTHKVLCKTRLELNRRLNPPTPAEIPPE